MRAESEPRRRRRVLFLTMDGPRGLGHLTRAARLARSIQELAACVLATGLRDTYDLVPEHCEYVRQRHARLLQSHYPIRIAEGAADLACHLRAALSGDLDRRPIRETGALAFDACGEFARLVAACPT